MKKPLGWAVLNDMNQIDSYYEDIVKAERRAEAMAQNNANGAFIAEIHVVKKITAYRGPWTYKVTEL